MNKFRQRQLYEPAHEENSGDVYFSLAHRYSGFDVTVLYESVLNVLSVPCITATFNLP